MPRTELLVKVSAVLLLNTLWFGGLILLFFSLKYLIEFTPGKTSLSVYLKIKH